MFGWKHYKNSGFGTFSKRKKGPKLTKLLSWKSVQGCVENPSKYVAQHNWTDFQRKKLLFCSFFIFCWKISFSLQKEEDFWKTKTERKEIFGRIFNSKKGNFWTDFQLYSIYIYIYIYCEVIIWAKFGVLKGYYLGQVRVIIWAKWGLLSGPSLFSHYKNRGFRRFFAQLSFFFVPSYLAIV